MLIQQFLQRAGQGAVMALIFPHSQGQKLRADMANLRHSRFFTHAGAKLRHKMGSIFREMPSDTGYINDWGDHPQPDISRRLLILALALLAPLTTRHLSAAGQPINFILRLPVAPSFDKLRLPGLQARPNSGRLPPIGVSVHNSLFPSPTYFVINFPLS
jgi:hypothetical protein